MVETSIINAPEWANYLGEFMTELPVNCLFNKTVTGCGGTELALRNDKHTIIAMPFIPLVINKTEKEEHRGKVLGVSGITSNDEIEEYIRTHEVWKIAAVYNSVPRVIKIFQDMGINPYEECFLLVDEYHILFNQYVFRNSAIKQLLSEAKDFKEKTYMTATPIYEEFMLEELKDMPVYEVVWPNKRVVTVTEQPTSSPLRYTKDLITDKLNDKVYGNLHIFVNSVKFIAGVLKRTAISPDDVKIVCANSKENERKLLGYKIGKPSDAPCKVNFYTSTCFEGCDIYDEEGKTYIISEGRNPHTLYDISTLFIQIIGRIRNSKYRDNIFHVVSNTQYNGTVSYQDFKTIVEKEYEISIMAANGYNAHEKHLRKQIYDKWGEAHFMNRFLYVNKDYNFEIDRNLLNKNLIDYKLKTEVYNRSYSLIEAYRENGLNAQCLTWKGYSDKLKANPSTRGNFEEAIEEYHVLITTQKWGNNRERIAVLEAKYPFLKEAYSKLEMNRIRALRYNITLIKRELVKLSDKPQVKKIIELMVTKIGYHNAIDRRLAKDYLKEVYEILGIPKNAKASNLNQYFIVNEFTKDSVKMIELIREINLLPE